MADRSRRSGSGAEQDHYGSYFSISPERAEQLGIDRRHLFQSSRSGAEQERYGSHFSISPERAEQLGIDRNELFHSSRPGAEQDKYGSYFGNASSGPPGQDNSRFLRPGAISTIGIFRSTLLPSFGIHSGLSILTYAASRATGRVELKDWLWPSGPVINAWWSAVGRHVACDGVSLATAWRGITYPEKLLLAGVTAWGGRLFYRIASRSIKRGRDDPRYDAQKQKPDYWDKSLFAEFLPESLFQSLISLPFSLTFRAPHDSAAAAPTPASPDVFRDLAIFVFSAGFALEVLSDYQLSSHKKKSDDVNREGVWSIVRHPNYLGDAIVHFSFPLLLYSTGMLHPLALLAPLANYAFLRCVGGDKENDVSQEVRYRGNEKKHSQFLEYRRQKNSFWPKLSEACNPWAWAPVAVGVAAVAVERAVRSR